VSHEENLIAQRDAPVGGQAVMEGVMMRGVSTWAVAVRKPATPDAPGAPDGPAAPDAPAAAGEAPADPLGPIEIQSFPLVSWTKRHRAFRLPIVRGVVALADSMAIGFRALGISANAGLPEDEEAISGAMWAGTLVVALLFAVGLFFVVPVGLTSLIKEQLGSSFLFWLVEGVVRTAIFLAYLTLLSRKKELRRLLDRKSVV